MCVLQCAKRGNAFMKTTIFHNAKFISIGYSQASENNNSRHDNNKFYTLHYVLSGKGTYYYNQKSYTVTSGQFFVIPPFDKASYAADSDDPWSFIWINFTAQLSNDNNYNIRKVFDFHETDISTLFNFENTAEFKIDYLVINFFQHILDFLYAKPNEKNYVNKTKNYILSNFMNNVNLTDLSQLFGINKRYLSRMFKQQEKISFQDFLVATRLKKADEYLRIGYNVSEVATMCGYKDVRAFSKAFKKYYSISPKEIKALAKTRLTD